MTTPTGNRWVDQDTGKVANPDNIQTDLAGHSQKQKYGPLVTGEGNPPEKTSPTSEPSPTSQGQAGSPITAGDAGTLIQGNEGEVEVEDGDELPDVGRPKLGTGIVDRPDHIAAENAEIEQAKLDIRELNRQATKGDKSTQKAAKAALEQIAVAEYGRPDGGREPLKRILARYGYANPKNR